MMTAFGTVETAIEAMKLGAFDYLQKPFSTEELILKLDRLINYKEYCRTRMKLSGRQLGHNTTETKLIGKVSPAIRDILEQDTYRGIYRQQCTYQWRLRHGKRMCCSGLFMKAVHVAKVLLLRFRVPHCQVN